MTRLAYILAASHSGSTLTAMLLGGHPEVCTVGELKVTSLGDVERYKCACGAPITECTFWRGISAGMRRRGVAFDVSQPSMDIRHSTNVMIRRLLRPLHRGPIFELARDSALSLVPAWHGHRRDADRRDAVLAATVLEQAGKQVLVDSSKIGVRLKYLLRNTALDVRVIRLVRDGRAVSLTYIDPAEFADARDARYRDGGMGGDRQKERLSMQAAAHEWLRSNQEADAILRRVPASRWLQLRYEDLCANPLGTLRRLCQFLGVDSARASLDFRRQAQHVVGNGMRFDNTDAIQVDERWRTALSQSDLKTFDIMAGSYNRLLGYR